MYMGEETFKRNPQNLLKFQVIPYAKQEQTGLLHHPDNKF